MSATLACKIEFEKLCNVLEEITKSKSAIKADILSKFIEQCRLISNKLKTESPDADVSFFPLLRLILPDLERERGANNLKAKSLASLYVRVFCLGKNSRDAISLVQYKVPTDSKKNIGSDFAEKACRILQNRLPRESSGFTIERMNLFLDSISRETVQQKEETFKVLLGRTSPLELKWITRIILKDLRLGIGRDRILGVFHPDAARLFDVSSNLRKICDTLHDPRKRFHHDVQVFSHFKPMLLERLKIEDAGKLFVRGEQYFVQSKYDGERSQMHMKDGKYKYFTRQGYDITNNPGYGETRSSGFMSGVFGRLLNGECKSIILDGELMGWHKEKRLMGSKGMSFDVKKLSENSHHKPCFVAFDIIMYNDVLLTNEPYEKRMKILKDAFKEEEGCLMLCKSTKISKSEELINAFNESMKNKEEGLAVKICDCKYKPNARDGSGCYKIKAEFSDDLIHDVDLIILGGYYGEGRFMNLMKSFLMGVALPPSTPGENPSEFYSVVSVSSGLSKEELEQLWRTFKDKWQTDRPSNVTPPRLEPPNLWIRPENSIILTIRASEMTKSNDYPLKYSLRFPRVMKVRADKPWHGVCTTTELLSLVKDTRPIQKLTKRPVDHSEIGETSKTKVRKAAKVRTMKFDESSSKPIVSDSPPVLLTRLLDGKEICVINGDNELSKQAIEHVLLQHGAKVVQNQSEDNYCIIVGNAKTVKAKNIIQRKEYDVVTIDWFKRTTKEENWPMLKDFFPWDLLSRRESTNDRLAQNYDDYYDHFYEDADEESLKFCFQKAEEEAKDLELDCEQMREIDEELFEDGVSPYSLFRSIIGYFDDPSDCSKFKFRFMAGTVKESIDDSVTHVFINENSISPELRKSIDDKLYNNVTILFVKNEWIDECFKQGKIVPETMYIFK